MDALVGLVRHSGNAALFQAVEMSVLSTLAGVPLHLHAEGLRGTGKTTILRAARRVLPRIRRIAGCRYNCDPAAPHCPQHRDLDPAEVAIRGEEWVPMPFLEISHSAKVGTVVGSIDLGRLVSAADPAAALLPGTLPQAHRGIVFVDEVNRLAETSPELADVLLDAMGTRPGRVQIEETGLAAVELPLSISVWAASNPDEDPGPLEEIRRQLSDRFDFVIPTTRPGEAAVVAEILARFDGSGGGARPLPLDPVRLEAYRAHVVARLPHLRQVDATAWLRSQVAEIYARFGLESLRAAQAMLWGMRLSACLGGRTAAGWEDLAAVVPLALHHRVDGETLGRVLQHVRNLAPRAPAPALPEAAGGTGHGTPPGGWMAGSAAAPAGPPAPAGAAGPGAGGDPGSGCRSGARSDGARSDGARGEGARGDGAHGSGQGYFSRLWSNLLGRPPQGDTAGTLAARGAGAGPGGRAAAGGAAGSLRPERLRSGLPPVPGDAPPPAGLSLRESRPGQQGQGPVHLPDPTQLPPVAPPMRARPVGALRPAELVSTEADLRRPGE